MEGMMFNTKGALTLLMKMKNREEKINRKKYNKP